MCRIKPDYVDALMSIANVLGDLGRMEEGLENIEQASRISSDNPDVHSNLGVYLLRMGTCAHVRTIKIIYKMVVE